MNLKKKIALLRSTKYRKRDLGYEQMKNDDSSRACAAQAEYMKGL